MDKFNPNQSAYSARRIGRRDFLGRALAVGALTTLPSGLMVERALAASPKQGGRLRVGVRGGAITDSLEVPTLTDTPTYLLSTQIRSNLTEIDQSGKLVGELAESWDVSPDASQWVFKLRSGVEFHNGKILDADDVVYSMNLHRGDDSNSRAKNLLSRVVDIKADGKDTVIFSLREGNADFPTVLSGPLLSVAINGTSGAEWEKGIGTGPFTLSEWNPGVRGYVERNSNYFKEGRPYLDEVEIVVINDSTARVNALLGGEVDAIEDPEVKILDRLANAPGMQILDVQAAKHFTFPMLTDAAPFDNNDIRLAIKYAVDRQKLLDVVLDGHGYLGNDHPIGRNNPYFDTTLAQFERDLDQAKFHMKRSGHSNVSVQFYTADGLYSGAVEAATLLKENLEPVGINVEIVRTPIDGYWSDTWLKKAWCGSWWSARPTADMILSSGYESTSDFNETRWKNSRFDELLVLARGELDEDKRRAMYSEMQALIRGEGGALIPIFANYLMAATSNIQTGDNIGSDWTLDGHRCGERWWFV